MALLCLKLPLDSNQLQVFGNCTLLLVENIARLHCKVLEHYTVVMYQ